MNLDINNVGIIINKTIDFNYRPTNVNNHYIEKKFKSPNAVGFGTTKYTFNTTVLASEVQLKKNLIYNNSLFILINMNDYKISCLKYRDEINILKAEKQTLQKRLNEIDIKINLINKYSIHKWKQERESGLYGERYYCCEDCGVIK